MGNAFRKQTATTDEDELARDAYWMSMLGEVNEIDRGIPLPDGDIWDR